MIKIRQIRNATIIIDYFGKRFLIDPWLQAKDTAEPFIAPDDAKNQLRNPGADLPCPIEEILKGIDAHIITHIHRDHFEEKSAQYLNKNIPTFVQNSEDAMQLRQWGYENVHILSERGTQFGNVTLYKTLGQHGEFAENTAGKVCGIIFSAKEEKTLYLAGDTIWYDGVEKTIATYHPDIIVVNSCAATARRFGRLIMNADDVLKVCDAAPKATIIASHMDTVNHAYLTRDELKTILKEKQMQERVLVPDNGEIYML